MVTLQRFGAIATLALAGATAQAIDVGSANVPAPIPDGTLSIGGKELRLPEQEWTLVGLEETSSGRRDRQGARSERFRGVAVAATTGAMAGAVLFEGLERRSSTNTWSNSACVEGTALHFELIDTNPVRPECLMVSKGRFIGPESAFAPYRMAADWARGRGIPIPAVQYNIGVARYIAGDFAVVRVLVPVEAFASDAEAVDWGRTLAKAMHPLVGGTPVRVPDLPRAAGAGAR
jgi:hypothetical protein